MHQSSLGPQEGRGSLLNNRRQIYVILQDSVNRRIYRTTECYIEYMREYVPKIL